VLTHFDQCEFRLASFCCPPDGGETRDDAYLLAFAPDCDCILPMGSLALCLHKLLGQLSVSHTFSFCSGAGYACQGPERQEAAIRFIGDALICD
jgi:hypothetical protein